MPSHATRATTESAPLRDEEVVARVLAGETALFEVIMRRYNQRLFRAARAIVRTDAEAEDVVQHGYLSAYAHLGQFAGQAKFSTWLTRIVLNQALGDARRRVRLAEVDLEEDVDKQDARPNGSPEDQASARELAGLLEQAIDELPEIYRIVVMLRDVQELSTAETAGCLELTEEAVKVRLHRARALLRQSMTTRLHASTPRAFEFLGTRCDRLVAAVLARLPAPGA